METPSFLVDPEALPLYTDEPPPPDGPAITVRRREWTGSGNPASVHRGVWVEGHDGVPVVQRTVEDARVDDPRVEAAIEDVRLLLIAELGRAHLNELQEHLSALDDGWAATPYTLLGAPEERRSFRMEMRRMFEDTARRQEQAGTVPEDTAEILRRVREQQATIEALGIRWATDRFDLLIHLARFGLDPARIAPHVALPADKVTKRLAHLTVTSVARIVGVKPATWRGYVARGQAPAADDQIGREPVWTLENVLAYLATRPGKVGRPAHS